MGGDSQGEYARGEVLPGEVLPGENARGESARGEVSQGENARGEVPGHMSRIKDLVFKAEVTNLYMSMITVLLWELRILSSRFSYPSWVAGKVLGENDLVELFPQ